MIFQVRPSQLTTSLWRDVFLTLRRRPSVHEDIFCQNVLCERDGRTTETRDKLQRQGTNYRDKGQTAETRDKLQIPGTKLDNLKKKTESKEKETEENLACRFQGFLSGDDGDGHSQMLRANLNVI